MFKLIQNAVHIYSSIKIDSPNIFYIQLQHIIVYFKHYQFWVNMYNSLQSNGDTRLWSCKSVNRRKSVNAHSYAYNSVITVKLDVCISS